MTAGSTVDSSLSAPSTAAQSDALPMVLMVSLFFSIGVVTAQRMIRRAGSWRGC